MIRSANNEQVFQKHNWSNTDIATQAWVNEIIWTSLRGTTDHITVPAADSLSVLSFETCRQSLLYNGLECMAARVYEDKLRPSLGDIFYHAVDITRQRTELFLETVHWLVGPKLGMQVLLIGDFAMRNHYQHLAQNVQNPRSIHTLQIWTPTLVTREDTISILTEGGFVKDARYPQSYIFEKMVSGISHTVQLMSNLWEKSKNWSLDIEREIWDRSQLYSTTFPLRLEITDLLILSCRRFSIDSLAGSAIMLLDVVTLLEQSADRIDWNRIRAIKNMFRKPDWLWAALIAADTFAKKFGRTLILPDWVRAELYEEGNRFFLEFIPSRMNWACPDQRIIEFTRAWVKVAKGT